jgi:hypothetical protein
MPFFDDMSANWTTAQVLALSPDSSSSQSGQQLARPNQWVSLGACLTPEQPALWGECQGRGKTPYRTQIDLSEPAFRCSCPSRKFPCKHALGLFLLFAEQPQLLAPASPPDWVMEWLQKRATRGQIQGQTQQIAQDEKPEKATDQTLQAKQVAQRIAKREAKIQAGLVDLDLFLRDLIRQGLASTPNQPYSYWDRAAARLVDAQAPGLAKRVRSLASLAYSGRPNWAEQLLIEVGKLHLLVQGYQKYEQLSTPVQAELRTQMGWAIKQEEVLSLAAQAREPTDAGSLEAVDHSTHQTQTCQDHWWVLGRQVTSEDDLQVQRIWLQGENTQRLALFLSFAHRSQVLDCSVWPGTILAAELVFYPGLYPLRALIKARGDDPQDFQNNDQNDQDQNHPLDWRTLPGGYPNLTAAMQAYGDALVANPWLETFPFLLNQVIPCQDGESSYLVDQAGHQLPLVRPYDQIWLLLALSGGYPLRLFGEWNGQQFFPLGVGTASRWVTLDVRS